MWKHEIIDCIQDTIKVHAILERAGVKTRYKNIKPVLQAIAKEAQVFYFGDRDDSLIPAVKTLKGKQFFFPLKMPFVYTIFEYTCNNPDWQNIKEFQHHSSKRCSLVFFTANRPTVFL